MAHYRKLTINKDTYEFNIGKKFVVIKFGKQKKLIEKKDIGVPLGDVFENFIVTPKMIRAHILGEELRIEDCFIHCDCEAEKKLSPLPFSVEIHDKRVYAYMCQKCFNENAEDI